MIKEIQIENFKSIKKMKLELGRINVFIGENGSGKSNILEAIALAGAAAAEKLDNEFLAARGIRATEPRHMRSALQTASAENKIVVAVKARDEEAFEFDLRHDEKPYSSWKLERKTDTKISVEGEQLVVFLEALLANRRTALERVTGENSELLRAEIRELESYLDDARNPNIEGDPANKLQLRMTGPVFPYSGSSRRSGLASIREFLIYSPENSSLRMFQREGQIEPLGINGEGLFKFLQVLDSDQQHAGVVKNISMRLRLLDWYVDLQVPSADTSHTNSIEISDRYLSVESGTLNQVSSNEGFLFLLFYFSLFSTQLTPAFFAIDNVDASLNPKLCAHLVSELATLARDNGKQAILTTHNPATLDGLDLNDDDQRLFVISRNEEGETRIKRIQQKEGRASTMKLSAAFIDGYLGGLPKNF
ncbi:hypothetical protein ABB28_14020 [Stenotrophomonas chelatiphaga]|uniref:ATPase AAA-type core domain-containing protein n=1 Tax=Stenotrophomonas chelatiphaga TaxID=517011 RepID=A0A0R0CTY6_9GAMM|nr:AAA family ATPase [Stenotrophomonas chelatiphaga]KRG72784.1 hypothetical protein ABB28_14020 [Stenotrophomonas chelatiphaga]